MSTSAGVFPTNVQPVAPANQIQANRVPLAIGVTLGVLALVVSALSGVGYRYRRRGRTPVDLTASPLSPYTVPPMGQAGLQSPNNSKYPPRLALPYGTPVDPTDLSTSSHVSEFEPPPSYEPSRHERRVGAAQ